MKNNMKKKQSVTIDLSKYEYDRMFNTWSRKRKYSDVDLTEKEKIRYNSKLPPGYTLDEIGNKVFNYDKPTTWYWDGWDYRLNKEASERFYLNKPKPVSENFIDLEEYSTYYFRWLKAHDMGNINYWGVRKGVMLEDSIIQLLELKGFKGEKTPRSGDDGIDIIVKDQYIKDNVQVFDQKLFQCKGTIKPCQPNIIREAIGTRFIHTSSTPGRNEDRPLISEFFVVCPQGFTREAKALAEIYNIILFDKYDLTDIYLRDKKFLSVFLRVID